MKEEDAEKYFIQAEDFLIITDALERIIGPMTIGQWLFLRNNGI